MRTTVTGYADQRIQVISQRVMTTDNLTKIIESNDLYPELRAKRSINAAVEAMRGAIEVEMISADLGRGQSRAKADDRLLACLRQCVPAACPNRHE